MTDLSEIETQSDPAPAAEQDAAQEVAVQVAIVIPMHNEEGAADALLSGIAAACGQMPPSEIIAVDDGSTDGTWARLEAARSQYPSLRLLRHAPKPGGQSAAVHSGVSAARAPIVLTLDGDGQNPPEELPKLFAAINGKPRVGLVAGQRVNRKDTVSKRLASQLANGIRGRLLKDGTRDTGCGLKAFRRDAFLSLPYFDHMHRYLPALFKAQGWEIVLVDVTHRERVTGMSKYSNLQRGLVGIWDLLGVLWLLKRAKKVAPREVEGE